MAGKQGGKGREGWQEQEAESSQCQQHGTENATWKCLQALSPTAHPQQLLSFSSSPNSTARGGPCDWLSEPVGGVLIQTPTESSAFFQFPCPELCMSAADGTLIPVCIEAAACMHKFMETAGRRLSNGFFSIMRLRVILRQGVGLEKLLGN